jgi:hypothetical protein
MRGLIKADGEEVPGRRWDDTAALHVAYLASLRRHRDLMNGLCETLEQFDRALEASDLPPGDRALIAKSLGRHMEQARTIIAEMDLVLARALTARRSHPK